MATRMDPVYPTTAKKKQLATYGKAARKRPAGYSPYAKEAQSASSARTLAESGKSDANGTRRLGDDGRAKAHIVTEEPQQDEIDEYAFPPDEPTTHHFRSRLAAPLRASVAKPAPKRKIPQNTATPRQAKKQRSLTPDSVPAPKAMAPIAANAPTTKPGSRATRTVRPKSTPPKDTAMQGAADSMPFSPATAQTLDKLSVGGRKGGLKQQEIPFRPTARSKVNPKPALLPQTSEDVATFEPAARPTVRPRRRLIDTLVAQAESSSDEDEDEDNAEGHAIQTQRSQKEELDREIFAAIDRLSPAPAGSQPAQPVVFERQVSQLAVAPRRSGLKYTYSSQRSYLADEQVGGTTQDILAQFSQPLLPAARTSAFDIDEDGGDEPSTTGAIRSVHELRQAGANNRFADELDDLVDRIGAPSVGKPSSSRRGALFELFSRLQDKAFLRQFRSHNGETNLFKNLGRESDIISGYSMVCILLTLLNTTALPVHLVQQLREEGIADLLALLLQHGPDIVVIARDRKSNISKHAQSLFAAMKTSTLKMANIWKSTVAPKRLSPRTLALKALERILDRPKLTAVEDQIISANVSAGLFGILSSSCLIEDPEDAEVWTSADSDEGVDLFLALALLEVHSTCAAQLGRSLPWTSEELEIAAELLRTVLRFRGECPAHLECIALKLVVNIANNNASAQRIFVDKGLFFGLADASRKTFETAVTAIKQDSLPSPEVIDSLVLMLGIMINFSEHDQEVGRNLVNEAGQSPVDRLILIFLDCRLLTADADSVEKSHMNVSFGYLAVLLGYLCHYGPIRERFESLHPGGTLEPLLSSIKQFGEIQKMLEASTQDHDPHGDAHGFSGRLQELASHLQSAY